MRKMTEESLKAAFAGESQAHMRYLVFAEVAEKEGKANIARLLRAIAYAEQVHATNHLRELGGIGKTPDNLAEAIAGETFEVEEMYPAYDAVAGLEGEQGAIRTIHYALEAEKIHAQMYREAKEAAQGGRDLELGPVHVCPVCGYTGEGAPPEYCPVCGAPRDRFKTF